MNAPTVAGRPGAPWWAEAIAQERQRQASLHGDRIARGEVDHFVAVTVLAEEVGEVARLVHDHAFGDGCYLPDGRRWESALRDELIQVAAVAVAMAESLR